MSKKFAEQISLLTDLNQIREMMGRNKTEIDNDFFLYLIEVKNAHVQANNYEDAIRILRILYQAGDLINNFYFSSFALFYAADLEIRKRDFDRAMNIIGRCIEECNKSTDVRCIELKAIAYHLQGELQFQQYADAGRALHSLQSSAQIYETLGRNEESSRVHARIESIRLQAKQEETKKPLNDILDEILESRDILQSLKMEIEARQRDLAEMQNQYDLVSAKVAELQQIQAALITDIRAIKKQIAEHQEKLDALRLRSSVLATAHETPLWVAAIRADIANGEISNLTLPLLGCVRKLG